MMKLSIIHWIIIFGLTSGSHGTSTVHSASDKPGVAIILNVLKDSFKSGERCGLVVTFANLGEEVIFIPEVFHLSVELRDSKNEIVQGKPILDPGPTPPHYYMEYSGTNVLMTPVLKLEPLQGVVSVVPDALDGYWSNMDLGLYSLRVPFSCLDLYHEDQVVVRTNTYERFWVRADTKSRRVPVSPQPVPIEIVEEKGSGG